MIQNVGINMKAHDIKKLREHLSEKMAFTNQTNMLVVMEEVQAYDHVCKPKADLLSFMSSSENQIEANSLLVAKQYTFEDLIFLL